MTRSSTPAAIILSVFLATAAPAYPSTATVTTKAVMEAITSERAWLGVVDSGQYGQSWDEAAALFKQHISKSQWEKAVGSVRAQTGLLKMRELQSMAVEHQLPEAPEGDYVVLVYRSSFATISSATETITAMRDPDGHWRVAGYRVK
jgi:hypothetical protein